MLLKGITTINGETLPPPPSFTPLLDNYSSSAKAGYSLRKLSSSAVNAIRVRRSSDNAELDIGFAGEHLDTAALLSFAGGGDGYVVILYDQSGNRAHMYQTTTATSQQKIVSAGSLIAGNGRPMGLFDGVNDFYACATGNEGYFTFLHDGTLYSKFIVAQFGFSAEPDIACTLLANTAAAATSRGITLRYDDRTSQARNHVFQLSLGNGTAAVASYVVQNNTGVGGIMAQLTFYCDPSNATSANRAGYRINGAVVNTGTTGTAAVSTAAQTMATRIGAITTGSNYMYGYIPELIILSGDQSANRIVIENNQKAYFNIS